MRRRDELDIVSAVVLQAEEHICKLRNGQRFSAKLVADDIVLTVNAVEIAAGKEYGPGAVFIGNARLLPLVQGSPRGIDLVGHTAEAASGSTVSAAFSRTQSAFSENSVKLHNNLIIKRKQPFSCFF